MKEKVWTAKEVEKVLLLAQDSISLNVLVNDEDGKDTEIGAFIEDPGPGPEELLLIEDRKNTIKNLMEKHLKPREVRLIAYRFGLDDGTPKTLEEVGRIFGLTRERVRQLEEKALRKLRIAFLRNGIVEKGEF